MVPTHQSATGPDCEKEIQSQPWPRAQITRASTMRPRATIVMKRMAVLSRAPPTRAAATQSRIQETDRRADPLRQLHPIPLAVFGSSGQNWTVSRRKMTPHATTARGMYFRQVRKLPSGFTFWCLRPLRSFLSLNSSTSGLTNEPRATPAYRAAFARSPL